MTSQEAYIWVYGIIDGCFTDFHFDAADELIELFLKKYPDEIVRYEMLKLFKENKCNPVLPDTKM